MTSCKNVLRKVSRTSEEVNAETAVISLFIHIFIIFSTVHTKSSRSLKRAPLLVGSGQIITPEAAQVSPMLTYKPTENRI